MAFNVSYVNPITTPVPTGIAMAYSPKAPAGPSRTDVSVTMASNLKNANGTFTIYVKVTGNYIPTPPSGTPIDSAFSIISTVNPNGFGLSVRSGSTWPGVTNKQSTFAMTFDAATVWPSSFQIQVGAANNTPAGTPNTVYVFSKSGVGAEDE